KPANSVFRLKAAKWSAKCLFASGIVLDKFCRIKTGMSHVATATSRNAHFCKRPLCFFKNCYSFVQRSNVAGSKHACCTSADDDNFATHFLQAAFFCTS